MGGIDESLNPPAGPLVLSRRMFGKKMHAAVDIGIPLLVIAGDGLDDSSWLLRSGGVIEVHQFLAADLSREDGEIPPNLLDIKSSSYYMQPLGGGFSGWYLGGCCHPISSQVLPLSSLDVPVAKVFAEFATCSR